MCRTRSDFLRWRLQKFTHLTHSGEHPPTASWEQVFGVTGLTMASSAETDYVHLSSPSGGDAVDTIFNNKAVTGSDAEFLGSKKKEIGWGLAAFDHGRAKDVRLEKSQETCDFQRVTDSVGMTVWRDADWQVQWFKQFEDAIDGSQFVSECSYDFGPRCLHKSFRHRSPEPLLDHLGETGAWNSGMVPQIFCCYGKPFGLKALAAYARVDELAIDEHPVAVENEKARRLPFQWIKQDRRSASIQQNAGHILSRFGVSDLKGDAALTPGPKFLQAHVLCRHRVVKSGPGIPLDQDWLAHLPRSMQFKRSRRLGAPVD
jgi:hypothetical protein